MDTFKPADSDAQGELNAPILIITCNRIGGLRRLISSLLSADGHDKTPLYIAIDEPYCSEVVEHNKEIKEYCSQINGFLYIKIITHTENIGPFENFNSARKLIFEKYSKLIFFEDDNEVSKNYLAYMNQALIFFHDDKKCFAICGYNYPTDNGFKSYSTDIYRSGYFCGWGVGYYRDRYTEPRKAIIGWNSLYRNPLIFWRTEKKVEGLISAILLMQYREKSYGDVSYVHHCIKNEMYCIFPTHSKVRNFGHDGSGSNCIIDPRFVSQKFYEEKKLLFSFELQKTVDSVFSKKNSVYFGGKSRAIVFFSYFFYCICTVLRKNFFKFFYRASYFPRRALKYFLFYFRLEK
jgi:hypothetical protein